LICLLACNLSADAPPIRVSVEADCDNCDAARMLSALSTQFRRKLDGVSVTDTQPALKIKCLTIQIHSEDVKIAGYAASVALISIDDHYIGQLVLTDHSIDALAHRIAITVDGKIIEQMRRDAQPPSSP
jgi:hypothetical protein